MLLATVVLHLEQSLVKANVVLGAAKKMRDAADIIKKNMKL